MLVKTLIEPQNCFKYLACAVQFGCVSRSHARVCRDAAARSPALTPSARVPENDARRQRVTGAAAMKRLVLETTAPFQGLPELVAYDEGLFEKEGLAVSWADRDQGVEKKVDTTITSPKGVNPFTSHG